MIGHIKRKDTAALVKVWEHCPSSL